MAEGSLDETEKQKQTEQQLNKVTGKQLPKTGEAVHMMLIIGGILFILLGAI